jgi:cell division protein FtsN
MQQDFKNHVPDYGTQKRRESRKRTFRLAAVLLGVGALGVTAYLVHDGKKKPAASAAAARSVEREESAATDTPAKQEPRFTFYKILTEQEVIIPDSEAKTLRREEQNSKAPQQTGRYYIQAGSFVSQQDAESLRTRMLQIRVPAKLEMIQIDNSTWFRVKVGPYATLTDVEKVRQYLRSHRLDSVVQKSSK